jgi:hypothetical protein
MIAMSSQLSRKPFHPCRRGRMEPFCRQDEYFGGTKWQELHWFDVEIIITQQ